MSIVNTPEQVAELLRLIDMASGNHVVIDTETTGVDFFALTDRRFGALHKGPLIEEEIPLGPAKMCGLTIGVPIGEELITHYLPVRHETAEQQLPLAELGRVIHHLEDRGATLVGHNIKFDLKALQADGMLPDDRKVQVEDTMLLQHVLDAEVDEYNTFYSLANMASRHVGHDVSWKGWVKDEFRSRKYRRFSQFAVSEMAPYSEDDTWMTWALRRQLWPHLTDEEAPWYGGPDLEQLAREDAKLIWVLIRMETRGMKVDSAKTEQIVEALGKQKELLQSELNTIAGHEINLASGPQLKTLFGEKGWPIPRDPRTGNATFADLTLTRVVFDSPEFKQFINLKQQYLSVSKMKGTYFESYLRMMDADGIVHPDFQEVGTVTGRLSCRAPNFQNVPRRFSLSTIRGLSREEESLVQSEVRSVFVPRSDEFRFVGRDYSQQEMRMFLHYAAEPAMVKVIRDGGDLHHFAAETLYGEPMPPKFGPDGKETADYKRRRAYAKIINFGILYGMGPKKLAEQMEVPAEQAQRFYDNYMTGFPGIPAFMKRVTQVADARLWIKNAYGRRYRFRLISDAERAEGKVRASGKGFVSIRPGTRAVTHTALNYLIQGGCADLSRRAMVRVDELLRDTKSALVNVIHDEMLYELHHSEEADLLPEIEKAMCDWPDMGFKLPFTATTKRSEWAWADAKEL